MKFLRIEDFSWNGKTVAVRVDLNSNVVDGRIDGIERFDGSIPTIRYLSEHGAKVVLLAHQGRPGGDDYVSLAQHSTLLELRIGKPVKFVNQPVGERARAKILDLKNSDILMLENTRFLDDGNDKGKNDEMSKHALPRFLGPLVDCMVQDALSVAHRGMPDTTGLYYKPNLAGLLMEKEINGLNHIGEFKKPFTIILGGAKPADALALVHDLKAVDYILAGGVLAELCFIVDGKKLGKKEEWLRAKGLINDDELKLIRDVRQKIITPVDLGVERNEKRVEINIDELPCNDMIFDIGTKTIAMYKEIIAKSATVYFKGPPGKFEDERFEHGTRAILQAIEASHAFSFAGGGQSHHAVQLFCKGKGLSYLSLAGGALEVYLAGQKLPVLELLDQWAKTGWDGNGNAKNRCIDANCMHRGAVRLPSATRTK